MSIIENLRHIQSPEKNIKIIHKLITQREVLIRFWCVSFPSLYYVCAFDYLRVFLSSFHHTVSIIL